jgi:hypothetical protein
MEITKQKNVYDTYTVKLKDKGKELVMYLAGTDDFFMAITDGTKLEKWYDDCRWMDITKENKDALNIISNLYEKLDKNKELKYEDNGLLFISDYGLEETEDRVIIQNYGDLYRLFFVRKNNEENKQHKSARNIVVRFATSGSRNPISVTDFIGMYQELEEIAEEKEKPKVYMK